MGRAEEVRRADAAIQRVLSGDGALLLFSGEAGIGKTRIVQTIANSAAAAGARVVWGRAWEAGGAPPYWPWLQIFRALGAQDDPFAAGDQASSHELPQARFAKFDGAARWLKEEASHGPVVLVLDDLHAADHSSLLFFHFLSRALAGSRLLVLATYRDVEARLAADVGTLLAKIAREGEAFVLHRLSQEDVRTWICAASGGSLNSLADKAERIYRVTEGNPLFVHELLRVRGTNVADATMASGLRAIMEEHLARVSVETRTMLEIGSVVGRELDPALIVGMSGLPLDDVHRALHEARDAGLLVAIGDSDRLSFGHILLRELLYGELAPSRRARLHSVAGEEIFATGGDPATATHHLLAGESMPSRIAELAREAARIALGRLAFEDASAVCERALAKHTADDEVTFDLELLLGESLIRGGGVTSGQTWCARAAARAKRMGAPMRQAQAALVYAIDALTGSVDTVMVHLLRDALDALPEEESPMRARILARYAASLVPPPSPEEGARVAREGEAAIEMARRTGDAETLLYALASGGSAMGYFVAARKRHELLREIITLAEALERPLVLLGMAGFWVASLREHGALAEADVALAKYERLVERFPQAHYRWRIPMLQATRSGLAGDFDTADRLCAEAAKIAEEGDLRAGKIAWALCRVSFACLRDDLDRLASERQKLEPISVACRTGEWRSFSALIYAATGRHEEARAALADLETWIDSYLFCVWCGEAVVILGDTELAERVYPRLLTHAAENTLLWGPFGSVVFGPTQRIAADLARLLGKTEDARRLYDEAVAIGERMAAPALITLAKRRRAMLDSDGRATEASVGEPLSGSGAPARVSSRPPR
ncbi:MAG TPA: AAA family ATPase, partial [Labilithrix sp.]|nr:AAA family ATPase [Labilithrix sp.]